MLMLVPARVPSSYIRSCPFLPPILPRPPRATRFPYTTLFRSQGGWVRGKNGRLQLRAGGRLKKLLTIFSNPKMPSMQDYYEPWTYDYETLLNAPAQDQVPVAQPYSLISGRSEERRVGQACGSRRRTE